MAQKSWEDLTKAERIKMIIEDSKGYIKIIPPGHVLGILEGIAKTGPIESQEQESNPPS